MILVGQALSMYCAGAADIDDCRGGQRASQYADCLEG
jgi:hypothetical protein